MPAFGKNMYFSFRPVKEHWWQFETFSKQGLRQVTKATHLCESVHVYFKTDVDFRKAIAEQYENHGTRKTMRLALRIRQPAICKIFTWDGIAEQLSFPRRASDHLHTAVSAPRSLLYPEESKNNFTFNSNFSKKIEKLIAVRIN